MSDDEITKMVRTSLESFVSLTYCMSYGRLSAKESEVHQRILVAILDPHAVSHFQQNLSSIKDDVAELCNWVEQGGGVLPYIDPETWDCLRFVRIFFDIENDMKPAVFYMQTPQEKLQVRLLNDSE